MNQSHELDPETREEQGKNSGGKLKTGSRDGNDHPCHLEKGPAGIAGLHAKSCVVFICLGADLLYGDAHEEKIQDGYKAPQKAAQDHGVVERNLFRHAGMKDQKNDPHDDDT